MGCERLLVQVESPRQKDKNQTGGDKMSTARLLFILSLAGNAVHIFLTLPEFYDRPVLGAAQGFLISSIIVYLRDKKK